MEIRVELGAGEAGASVLLCWANLLPSWKITFLDHKKMDYMSQKYKRTDWMRQGLPAIIVGPFYL